MRRFGVFTLLAAFWCCLPAAAQTGTTTANTSARNQAGKIELVAGAVSVIGSDTKIRVPKKGEALVEGDSIVTGPDGELHAELTDGGVIAVRPNTAMRIASYQANGDAGDTSIFGLVKGSFRSITGWIGKNNPANYKILTPTATAGVRGTDHEPLVIPEGSTEGEPGTYDRVHAGSSFIEGKTGRVDITKGQVGQIASHGRDKPRVLDQVPAFFRPTRNEKRIEGRHDKVVQRADQRRAERQKAVAGERANAESRKARTDAQEQRKQVQAVEREKRAQQRQQALQKVAHQKSQVAQQRQQVQQKAAQQHAQAAQQRAQKSEKRNVSQTRGTHAIRAKAAHK